MSRTTLDELMEKVDSRYTLVVVAAKRARILTERGSADGNGASDKPVTTSLKEIAANKVTWKRNSASIK
ncbi:MAG: DNA-directed RNA polymerase subunit omega [Pelotomaculum sp. PtaB.Bin104]|nr:MAG: DNA-directed RNA polymerase subunit omega [Pelotomaculum sp. PtaB.Bin104]